MSTLSLRLHFRRSQLKVHEVDCLQIKQRNQPTRTLDVLPCSGKVNVIVVFLFVHSTCGTPLKSCLWKQASRALILTSILLSLCDTASRIRPQCRGESGCASRERERTRISIVQNYSLCYLRSASRRLCRIAKTNIGLSIRKRPGRRFAALAGYLLPESACAAHATSSNFFSRTSICQITPHPIDVA